MEQMAAKALAKAFQQAENKHAKATFLKGMLGSIPFLPESFRKEFIQELLEVTIYKPVSKAMRVPREREDRDPTIFPIAKELLQEFSACCPEHFDGASTVGLLAFNDMKDIGRTVAHNNKNVTTFLLGYIHAKSHEKKFEETAWLVDRLLPGLALKQKDKAPLLFDIVATYANEITDGKGFDNFVPPPGLCLSVLPECVAAYNEKDLFGDGGIEMATVERLFGFHDEASGSAVFWSMILDTATDLVILRPALFERTAPMFEKALENETAWSEQKAFDNLPKLVRGAPEVTEKILDLVTTHANRIKEYKFYSENQPTDLLPLCVEVRPMHALKALECAGIYASKDWNGLSKGCDAINDIILCAPDESREALAKRSIEIIQSIDTRRFDKAYRNADLVLEDRSRVLRLAHFYAGTTKTEPKGIDDTLFDASYRFQGMRRRTPYRSLNIDLD